MVCVRGTGGRVHPHRTPEHRAGCGETEVAPWALAYADACNSLSEAAAEAMRNHQAQRHPRNAAKRPNKLINDRGKWHRPMPFSNRERTKKKKKKKKAFPRWTSRKKPRLESGLNQRDRHETERNP